MRRLISIRLGSRIHLGIFFSLLSAAWEMDISQAVRAGENQLRIKVANTWNNRLVADAALPLAERQSYVSQPYAANPKAPLAASGLIGPVKISKLDKNNDQN